MVRLSTMLALHLMVFNLMCDQANGQPALPGMDAAVTNCEGYQNYEASLKFWRSVMAEDGSYETETNEESRILIDYEKELVIYCRIWNISKTLLLDGANAKKSKNTFGFANWFIYQNGKYDSNAGIPENKVPKSFQEYLFLMNIPRLEYAAFGKYPCNVDVMSEDENQRLRGIFGSREKSSSRLSPDGSRRETWVNDNESMLISQLFETEFLFPVTSGMSYIQNGTMSSRPFRNQSNTLENNKGLCRLVSSSYSQESTIETIPGKRVPTVDLSTLTIRWLQFNEDVLLLPDVDKLRSEDGVKRFVKAEE